MTKMTRQHFRAFADEIKAQVELANSQNEIESRETLLIARETARTVAIVCRKFSPAFNQERFMNACRLL